MARTCGEKTDVTVIRAPWSSEPDLNALVLALRSEGKRVVYELPGDAGNADPRGRRALRKRDGKWQIAEIDE